METGVEFNFSFAPGISEEQIIGIELAGEMWGNYLGDTQQSINGDDIHNTVINIHVEVASDLLPENVIGGSFLLFQIIINRTYMMRLLTI